jgi:hypothetical protein
MQNKPDGTPVIKGKVARKAKGKKKGARRIKKR